MNPSTVKRKLVWWDQLLGLRSWGLLIYASLPATLLLFGKLPLSLVNWSFGAVAFVLASPFLTLFLLIRAKHRQWYLTTDFLNSRSFFTTVAVLLIVSSMCGAVGVVQGRYVARLPEAFIISEWKAILESVMAGSLGLIVSSTVFTVALTKLDSLPGLPPPEFVEKLAKLRSDMILLQATNPSEWTEDKTIQRLKELVKPAFPI